MFFKSRFAHPRPSSTAIDVGIWKTSSSPFCGPETPVEVAPEDRAALIFVWVWPEKEDLVHPAETTEEQTAE
jgi:hypothetical protein